MADRFVTVVLKTCEKCPYCSRGFLSEASTCAYGDRKKTPYDFFASNVDIPDHCPLPKTSDIQIKEVAE
jgi:threonine dehydrogenase-like Zn-dependent dehydrogenase